MYTVQRLTHPEYGSIVTIERQANGSELTPFQAVQRAIKERRLWLEAGLKRVRILVDSQVLSPKQAERWAIEEYNTLPKCSYCAIVLGESLFTHQLRSDFFCSQDCADHDYNNLLEKIKDEKEIDYL